MSGCVHRWRIEEPTGSTSLGECVRCGATRVFGNSLEAADTLRGLNPTQQAHWLARNRRRAPQTGGPA